MTTRSRLRLLPLAALSWLLLYGCAPDPITYPEGHPAEARTDETELAPAPKPLEPHYVPPLPQDEGEHHHHPQRPFAAAESAPADAGTARKPKEEPPTPSKGHEHVH